MNDEIELRTASAALAADIAAVMSDCGDASRCWCAWWSRPRQDFEAGLRGGNKRWFLKRLDTSPHPIGLLAYVNGEPAAWCAVAPRADHGRLGNSRSMAAVDDLPVWSITCFVVAKRFRRQGLMRRLIDGAVVLAREHGAPAVEGYPLVSQRKLNSGELYVGSFASYADAGFEEVARHTPSRAIMRRRL
jgi:GNAT superfamily N-acetyltransferase